ncbi:rhomboid family intramembrane serine protease [Nitratireductor sp. ZSWI3]|uniref:rhomboid family intramembrane serine protease n=1 Tax=Nitratireductor sp. ZSWI3 TaxID=2966359 RepID=UPI0021501EAD|nr:rhomboid family intramembrane serine protease [Nitratireductor sp. ZSWI3]MCR4266471.1 rhomboid family intramembrane serine protease [Nitratireductor sp. ZSWI3]
MEPQETSKDDDGGQGREPVFNLAPAVVAFGFACIAIYLVQSLWLGLQGQLWLTVRFAFLPIRYTGPYPLDLFAFVSPVAYSLLHGSMAHLLVNMIWLAAFGSPLANRIGTLRFVLFWVAGALAAVALHFVLHPTSAAPLVGASGSISAMMGAAARFAFRVDRRQPKPSFAGPVLPFSAVLRSRTVLVFLAVWMVVNLVTGLGIGASAGAPQIAWEAHIGGFLLGFLGIRLFDRPHGDAAAGAPGRP